MARFTARSGLALIWWGRRGAEMRWQQDLPPVRGPHPPHLPHLHGAEKLRQALYPGLPEKAEADEGPEPAEAGALPEVLHGEGVDEEGADHLVFRGQGQGLAQLGLGALEDPPQVLLVAPKGKEEEQEAKKLHAQGKTPKEENRKKPQGQGQGGQGGVAGEGVEGKGQGHGHHPERWGKGKARQNPKEHPRPLGPKGPGVPEEEGVKVAQVSGHPKARSSSRPKPKPRPKRRGR
jgi:hypothetical protein